MREIFKDNDTATVDEFTVSRDEFQKSRDDGGGGFIVKRYTFSKTPVEQNAPQAQ